MSQQTDVVRVTDVATGKLKRFENSEGRTLAIMSGDELVLTDLGRRRGYSISGKRITKKSEPAF